MSFIPPNSIGFTLCCINNTLRQQQIYVNRTCVRKTYTPQKAHDLALQNVKDLLPILGFNFAHNIRGYRVSSDMLPHYTDPEVERFSLSEDIIRALQQAGDFANNKRQRITMHPGQFCVVGTPSADIFQKTVEDLDMHAMILDTMNINQAEGILCVHGGGVYGDKEATKRRWIEQFDDLPRGVKSRLALENCEKSYSPRDCLDIAQACDIPVIYDTHHYRCYKQLHPNEDVEDIYDTLPEIVEGWKQRGCRPLFHVSDQAEGKQVGAHHDYVQALPEELLHVVQTYRCGIDVEVEAKAKELAIFHLMKTYPTVFPTTSIKCEVKL
jgi:UV DNA damage endonuclease